ncbi:MAG: cytochrome c [Bacteroidia bacterium]|nr:cytochrome c [Bacteroidia bacterium]
MYRSPSYETYSGSPLFSDSLSARLPVAGSIPRGYNAFFEYENTLEGYAAAGSELKNPLEKSETNVLEGERLYNIYCTHCHGKTGMADGSVIKGGAYPPPPAYSDGKSSRGGDMKDLSEGKIYHTIVYGLNLMGAHASQISPEERWKIIMHVQNLQNPISEKKETK